MNTIVDVAFGQDPGRWPLPTAVTPREHWLRAVAAGGQGRYASALADLDALDASGADAALASVAFSTRASFLRQLGGHVAARSWDGRAWARAGADADAGVDALIGLAADALGTGRFGVSHRLLRRAGDLLDRDATGRLPVRLAWVSAELAMVTGDGTHAVEHAERAVASAAQTPSVRHAIKSQVVLAAARCSAGDVDTARRIADEALVATERFGLLPLSWALSCMLVDVGSATHPPARIATVRDGYAEDVRRRGGHWTAR